MPIGIRSLAAAALMGAVLAAADVSFEAATVKPNRDGGRPRIDYQPGGQLVAANVTLRQLVRNAYRVHELQLFGGPAWVTRDAFDIVATAGQSFPQTREDGPPGPMQQMLQTLLRQRFQLQVHTERRELDAFALVRARAGLGPALRRSTSDCLERPPCERLGTATILKTNAATMEQMAATLAMRMGRPVVDKTGLEGAWEVELHFSADPKGGIATGTAVDDNPPIVTALQEQLGLKLEPRRIELDVLVIDSAERPAAE